MFVRPSSLTLRLGIFFALKRHYILNVYKEVDTILTLLVSRSQDLHHLDTTKEYFTTPKVDQLK